VELNWNDTTDFENADRGFMGTINPCVIKNTEGRVVWDGDSYDFITGEAPPTVHPSLWRQSILVSKHGLYEITEGIYQVRGFDLSNITFVEGDTGIIVIDPLISAETAAAALHLYRQHRGERQVKAVIYSHSHVDHFGGVLGVTSAEAVESGEVQIIAPEGLLEHAISENVYAGAPMGRRASYMYGGLLPRNATGAVGSALGQNTSTGSVGILPPTIEISRTGERLNIDSVEIEFQVTPDTEAPAEMNFYFPGFRALCVAENATHVLHNLLTLRGALVRDAHSWARYLTETIDLWADQSEVAFASHHWPTWGSAAVIKYLSAQRDVYAYLHDEVLRLMGLGYQGTEIAEIITLPPALETEWSTRGYYGSISHNVKAIYQRYMGWFDGNPVNLWTHPPKPLADRYVAAMGGIEKVCELAETAVAEDDLRWAATLLGHAVFADESHETAKTALADVLEKLGFGSENAIWRNFYLTGAMELRNGVTPLPGRPGGALMKHLQPSQIFDSMAINIDGPKAWNLDLEFDFIFTDLSLRYRVTLRNGILVHRRAQSHWSAARTTVTLTKDRLFGLILGDLESAGLEIVGDSAAVGEFLGVLSAPNRSFPIMTPRDEYEAP